jgi:hypothetical protein
MFISFLHLCHMRLGFQVGYSTAELFRSKEIINALAIWGSSTCDIRLPTVYNKKGTLGSTNVLFSYLRKLARAQRP